jgi:hypothetical protein
MRRTAPHPEIYQQVNLLAHSGWSDADGDGQADGYSIQADNSVFDGSLGEEGEQAVSRVDGGESYIYVRTQVQWPLSGVEMELSTFYQKRFSSGKTEFLVRQLSYDDDVIQDKIREIDAGQERKEFTFGTLPQAFTLSLYILRGYDFSESVQAKIRDPALRIDGSGEYANY